MLQCGVDRRLRARTKQYNAPEKYLAFESYSPAWNDRNDFGRAQAAVIIIVKEKQAANESEQEYFD